MSYEEYRRAPPEPCIQAAEAAKFIVQAAFTHGRELMAANQSQADAQGILATQACFTGFSLSDQAQRSGFVNISSSLDPFKADDEDGNASEIYEFSKIL